MIIKQIELVDFRIYKGSNILDLSPEPNKNIFIVSGKNGFGKTTFLMSLVWCLYGRQMQDVDELYKKEIADQGGYPKYIVNSLNRQARIDGRKSFSVKLVINNAIIPELSCNEIQITRTYNTQTGEENLDILIDGFENELIRDLRNEKMRGEENFIRDYLLPIEIAKFFFFDAEKVVNLAEVNTPDQRRNLSQAYSEILGIKKYEDTRREIEDTQLRLRSKNADIKEQEYINNLEAEIRNAELEIANNEDGIGRLENQKIELRYESDEIQRKLIRVGSLITIDELETIRNKERGLESDLKNIQDDLAKSYDIIPFAIAGGNVNELILQINSESEYKQSKFNQDNIKDSADKVIDDLIEEQKKFKGVITRNVQDFYFDTITKLIKKHFFSDVPEFAEDFEVLHDFSEAETNELNALVSNLKSSFQEHFKRLNFEYNATRNELQQIRRRIADAEAMAEDAIVKADRERKAELDKKIEELSREIFRLELRNKELSSNIIQKEKLREDLRKRLKAAAKDKVKDKLTEDLSRKLREYINIYKDRKKKSLADQILSGLQKLMHKKGFVERVEVAIRGEDIEIDLYDKTGDVIRKEGLSKGEQQLYATALLHGLVEESDIEFPVFIDSPMQKFDEEHAENIVKFFYPSISEQVILFPLINKELSAREYEMLLPNVARAFLIVNKNANQSGFEQVEPAALFDEYNALYNI
jgi:DNA sulfur modification protein DndD